MVNNRMKKNLIQLSNAEILGSKNKLDGNVKMNFPYFLQRGFLEISPASMLYNSWYLDLISEYLEAVEQGKIKRLIINIPPRHLKSLTVNVFWTAWLLGNNPSLKIISTSYSNGLSIKHSCDTRHIMGCKWYKNLFPNTQIAYGTNTKQKFITTKQGFRLATSVGGTLTGEGGDILIVDDPHSVIQSQSKKHRQRALNWFDQTLMTRLNNPQEGKVVVVMQRLHAKDLTGYLIQKNSDWEICNIPAFEERERYIRFNNFSYKRKSLETLNKKVCDYSRFIKIKEEIGSYAFAAQYLQQPISDQGAMIKTNWIKNYDAKKLRKFTHCFQSWDCAFKTGKNNDYSVCATFGIMDGKIYLCDIFRAKLQFNELKQMVKKKYLEYNPQGILIEDKASGQILIQDLMREYTLPILKVRPKLDKLARFVTNLNLFEAGIIHLPSHALWVADFIAELTEFPNVSHDDQVDACTQFLNWWQTSQKNSISLRYT